MERFRVFMFVYAKPLGMVIAMLLLLGGVATAAWTWEVSPFGVGAMSALVMCIIAAGLSEDR